MAWRERPVTIAIEGEPLVLEGVWQSGVERAAVIAPPHPEFGGSLENPVVAEIAHAFYKARHASLRFNWRGVGASQGSVTGDPESAEADFRAALKQLLATKEGPVIGAGYSFGAATALRVALREPILRELLLVAPPISMLRGLPLEELDRPMHVIVGSEDTFAPFGELSERLAPLVHARIDVIPGVDHFFSVKGLAELAYLARAALSWTSGPGGDR
jgi:alpha/beta superfamily hydrolase